MCGRFVQNLDPKVLSTVFEVALKPTGCKARFNIAPGQQVVAVRQSGGGTARERVSLKWGLVPAWARDPRIGFRLINARSETVREKPAFRQAFIARRCLIPANGFYEWKEEEGKKQPYYISSRTGTLLAMAGLWESWRQPDGTILETCSILTTRANALVAALHERMPVLLAREDLGRWLACGSNSADGAVELLRPCPPQWLSRYAVSREVNRPVFDRPDCLNPVGESP